MYYHSHQEMAKVPKQLSDEFSSELSGAGEAMGPADEADGKPAVMELDDATSMVSGCDTSVQSSVHSSVRLRCALRRGTGRQCRGGGETCPPRRRG